MAWYRSFSLWTDMSISPRVRMRISRWISRIPLAAIAIGSINPSIWEAGRSIRRIAKPREKTRSNPPRLNKTVRLISVKISIFFHSRSAAEVETLSSRNVDTLLSRLKSFALRSDTKGGNRQSRLSYASPCSGTFSIAPCRNSRVSKCSLSQNGYLFVAHLPIKVKGHST